MNEFDRNAFKRNAVKERKKKKILTGIVICIITIIVLATFIIYLQYKDAHTFKVFANDVQMPLKDGFSLTSETGEVYVRAKDIAGYIGWEYQNGEYGSYTEEITSGYVRNGYEVASFVAGSNEIKKYIQVTAKPVFVQETKQTIEPYKPNSANGTLETAKIENPVIMKDNEIYFPLKSLPDICNCAVDFSNPYRMRIYEQNFLRGIAKQNAVNFGYDGISDIYENHRLFGYGRMVVKKGSLNGVIDMYSGKTIIGLKYAQMVFAQNMKEFFIKTSVNGENSIGIIDDKGDQRIEPKKYSDIKILSDELGLYLVEKDEKYGVLDREGKIVIHCEYDSIGIPSNIVSDFDFSLEDSRYLLFNNTIVVKKDNKYNLFNYEIGDDVTNPTPPYAGIGYIADDDRNAPRNAEKVLTIELKDLELVDGQKIDVKAIILQLEVDKQIKYGVYDAESQKLILPCVYDRIYSTTSKGVTEYYIELQGTTKKFSEQLAQYPEIFKK